MSKSTAHGHLNIEDAECLIMWPPGSVGHHDEFEMMRTLLRIAKKVGYGRLPEIANGLNELWRDPSKAPQIRADRDERNKMMARLSVNPDDEEASEWFYKTVYGFTDAIGEYGVIVTIDEFRSGQGEGGGFISQNGHAFYCIEKLSHPALNPFIDNAPEIATGVVWYNK